MKALIGLLMFLGGIAIAYGGTFATFCYGVHLMVKDGFWTGLLVSTLGSAFVFFVGVLCVGAGKVMVED